jgi:hypothetical protein
LLILKTSALGRELVCAYDYNYGSYALWPPFKLCKLSSVDLSESHKTMDHSFSGTPEQKSATTVLEFNRSPNIEFLPKEISTEFPNLNGVIIENCNLPTVKNDLFTKDFSAIQYLFLQSNKIETVEANAFQHLTKLRWIHLADNPLHKLPFQIFKNNLELIVIWFPNNKISSITPDFFKNLDKVTNGQFQRKFMCGFSRLFRWMLSFSVRFRQRIFGLFCKLFE